MKDIKDYINESEQVSESQVNGAKGCGVCNLNADDMIGKQLTSKMLKTQGLNDYINNIIVKLEDYDKSGKIDVNDFLNMNNEEILKENDVKKFDICLMNPPYQQRHNDNPIHFQFVEKCFEIAESTGYNYAVQNS